MHRSGSTTRASDFYLANQGRPSSAMEIDHLPTYDPQSDSVKKEAMKLRFAQNMVHIIPLVLILCALVLWLFSNPEINVMNKEESIIARVKNMTLDGYSNWNGSSMVTGMDDLDPVDSIEMEEPGKVLGNNDPE